MKTLLLTLQVESHGIFHGGELLRALAELFEQQAESLQHGVRFGSSGEHGCGEDKHFKFTLGIKPSEELEQFYGQMQAEWEAQR
jgi:hypothetical protein